MAVFTVSSGSKERIKLDPSRSEEILQNVRMIISTPRFSIPLVRGLGLSAGFLDAPMPVAQAKLSSEIATALALYEPRAELLSVTFQGDDNDKMSGRSIPVISVRIPDDELE